MFVFNVTTTIALFPGDMSGFSPATCRWGKVSPATCRWGILAGEASCGESWFRIYVKRLHDFTPYCRMAWWLLKESLLSFGPEKRLKDRLQSGVNCNGFELKKPTGWIPEFSEDEEDDDHSEQEFISSEHRSVLHMVEREDNRNSDGAKTNSTGSRKFKMSEIPRTGDLS
ncbi:hypothetical protein Tco_0413644 [Tanacetum coccineum]